MKTPRHGTISATATVVWVACLGACAGSLPRPQSAEVPAPAPALVTSAADLQAEAETPLTFVVVDPDRYGLSILLPDDGTTERRVIITAPGLPFEAGRIEFTVLRDAQPEEVPVYQDTLTYAPLEPTVELPVDLPEELPPGNYTVEAKLILYGDVPGVESGQVERVRRVPFVRGGAGAPTMTKTVIVDDYVLNQRKMLPEQVQRLAKGVHDMALVDVVGVSVVGHTCDVGGPVKNAIVGTKRAATAAAELRGLGLPKNIEPQLIYRDEEFQKPASASPEEEEKERRKFRRVEVIITYRLREQQ